MDVTSLMMGVGGCDLLDSDMDGFDFSHCGRDFFVDGCDRLWMGVDGFDLFLGGCGWM